MLKGALADFAMAVSSWCVRAAEQARLAAERWNARATWCADASEWLQSWKSWAEIRNKRGGK